MTLGQALWQIGGETAAMECAPMAFSGAGVNKDTHALLEIIRPAEALVHFTVATAGVADQSSPNLLPASLPWRH